MKTKPKRPLTPAQIEARLAAHKLSWVCLLQDKLDKLSFPSLTQGARHLTPGKKLADQMFLIRHLNPDFAPVCLTDAKMRQQLLRDFGAKNVGKLNLLAELGLRLERALLERDTKFLSDYRKAYLDTKRSAYRWRDVYSWMLSHYWKVEACHTPAEIWRLVKTKFSLPETDRSNFYRTLREVGLPVSKPCKKRSR